MSDLASHTPADPALVAHLTAGIAEARAIYELLFPTQQLFFVLSQGNNPIWAAPEVVEGTHNPRPQDLGADYLGTLTRPGAYDGAPQVTIRLAIPRLPLPGEIKQIDAPWRPMRGLGALFRASPLWYEQVRYGAEMARKRQADRDRKSVV